MQDSTVTRAYLTDSIYKKLGYSRAECADLVDAVLEEMTKGLIKDEEVKISAFGSFKVKQKNPRLGRNPKTKAEVPISARKVVSFYVSSLLKERVNS
ncbi:MAG: integration host factor subunit alpha [Rickettsiaceae bacterium]|jgi:integration host factor subunit alpha|nr:integration host factor subunit alpha [Rickettsiaceae bacterium]